MMQHTKYAAAWLLVLVLVFSLVLTGCGKNAAEESVSEDSAVTETVPDTAEDTASEETAEAVEIESVSGDGIVGVTLIVKENDDGSQSVAGAAVEYGSSIDASSLNASDYSVYSGVTEYYVADIYTNSEAAFADKSTDGCFVILVLTENVAEAMEENDEAVEGPVSDAVELDEEAPFAGEEEPAVTPYAVDGEENETEGPEGWDPNAEVILGSSPMEEASGELVDETTGEPEATLTISVTQIDTVCTVDQVEIGPSPAVYESTAVVIA